VATAAAPPSEIEPAAPARSAAADFLRRHPTVVAGLAILAVMTLLGLMAPWLGTVDPLSLDPVQRLKAPTEGHWFGTDSFGRDIYSRTVYGSRISLIVGVSVAILSTAIGLAIGLVAGYSRIVDAIVMRIMDGMMAVPSILLAIALIALTQASVTNVILAITIPEVPRVVRLVRSVVLSIREQPYIEAAVAIGTSLPKIFSRHLLPNTLAPLIVQATYIFASAVLIEAGLSFVGAGTPPEVPSWGNIMAEGRTFFLISTYMILFPGLFLALTVLAVNLLGDGLRDLLDPRIARRM
jgi:peptide/nickel transport system permease protein